MNPHAADRLFNELTAAEMAHQLTGISVADFLKRRANRYHGETKKQMLRIAALGKDTDVWMDFFLGGMNEGDEE
jgi:hypothetical protein